MIYAYAAFRRAGFDQGMSDAGLAVDDELIVENAVTMSEGASAADTILDRPNAPTAIVCAVDFAALGVYRAAESRGLTIGKDLSVVAYDGVHEGAHVQPPLTTFSVDNRVAGSRLATLLIRRIRNEPAENLRETVPATFLDRGSTGPINLNPTTT